MENTNSVYSCLPVEPLNLIRLIKANLELIGLIVTNLLVINYQKNLSEKEKNDLELVLNKFVNEIFPDPEDSFSLYHKGFLLYKIKTYKDSLTFLDLAITNNKSEFKYFNIRGLVRKELNNPGGAMEDFNEAVLLNPKSKTALHNRAVLRSVHGNLKGAKEDLKKALDLEPKNWEILYEIGKIEIQREDFQPAILCFNKAIKLCPKNPLLYRDRGFAYYKIDRYVHAVKDINKSIELNPMDHNAFYYRGLARKAQLNKVLAIEDLKQALKINPNSNSIKKEIEILIKNLNFQK